MIGKIFDNVGGFSTTILSEVLKEIFICIDSTPFTKSRDVSNKLINRSIFKKRFRN